MDLKEFITETLVQITNGVIKAQELIKDTGAYINPEGLHSGENLQPGYGGQVRHIQKVKMSVAVNVIENSENKAGISVLSVFSAGFSTKNSDVNSVTNRIEFEIPISVPVMNVVK
jgi:hypothetical protein